MDIFRRWIRCPDRWQPPPPRSPRRQFAEEFKAQAVRLVLHEGKAVGAVACDLDLTESALRQRVERTRADQTGGRTGLTTAEREELAQLRKGESRAANGARHPTKSRGLRREAPSVRFAWVAAERAEFAVAECCRALRVSPRGFYAWQHRPESDHAAQDRQLRVLIRASHEGSRRSSFLKAPLRSSLWTAGSAANRRIRRKLDR